MSGFFTAFLIFCTVLVATGCSGEDPNPHLRDPIWKDLDKRATDHQKGYEESKVKLKELREKLEKIEPNSMDMKDIRREIAKTEKAIVHNEQMAKYFRIRADRRKVMDKISAREAKAAGKEWPDPREYSDYSVNIRMREVNLNWNSRVPKLQDRLSKASEAENSEKSETQSSSGH